MQRYFSRIIAGVMCAAAPLLAQHSFRAVVKDSATGEPLIGVTVMVEGSALGGATDVNGAVEVRNIPDGTHALLFRFIGYATERMEFSFPMRSTAPVAISLRQEEKELEEVTVTSTRTHARVEDAPVKVEVLGAEEMGEENSIKPGNVASILGDISGIQIQPTSAVSGNSVVRMQGLDGKYTLLLRDGMPAFGGLSGGLNILQIPPLDLRQVEIIKGPASTLFGGGAIAGLINFITKQPSDSGEATLTLNQTTLKESNINAYASGKFGETGYTVFAGYTGAGAVDVNSDGFSDLPKLNLFLLHPQVFLMPNEATHLRIGLNISSERRSGGDMATIAGTHNSLHQYIEENTTQSIGLDVLATHTIDATNDLSLKASANRFSRDFSSPVSAVNGRQWKGYSELYDAMKIGNGSLVVGGNFLYDAFSNEGLDTLGLHDYDHSTLGVFTQYSYATEGGMNLEAGLRADHQSVHGWFILPAAAALLHVTKEFSVRLNLGSGYNIPDLLETSNDRSFAHTTVVGAPLEPERSYGGTLEWNYRALLANEITLFINQSFFITHIDNALIATTNAGGVDVVTNASGAVVSNGIDTYVRATRSPFELYLGYTYTIPKKQYDAVQPYMAYTPLHRGAATFLWEFAEAWKTGIEASFQGKQFRDNGTETKSYLFLAGMVAFSQPSYTMVLNGENLLDFRQTNSEQVVFPPYATPSFATLWAPVDGRVINLSLLLHF